MRATLNSILLSHDGPLLNEGVKNGNTLCNCDRNNGDGGNFKNMIHGKETPKKLKGSQTCDLNYARSKQKRKSPYTLGFALIFYEFIPRKCGDLINRHAQNWRDGFTILGIFQRPAVNERAIA